MIFNQLTKTPEFANWYKSFADTLATSVENASIGIIFIGTLKDFNRIYKYNPSVTRIFHTLNCSLNDMNKVSESVKY